jgi:hypothetical protein
MRYDANTFSYGAETLRLVRKQYSDLSTAIDLVDARTGEPWARLSVRMPGDQLPEGVFRLKNWSENADIAEAVIGQGLVTLVNSIGPAYSGFISAWAYRLTTPL